MASSSEGSDRVVLDTTEEGTATAEAPAHIILPAGGKFVSVPPEIRDYALKMECPVYQINAQRFFGPPLSVALGWTPEKGSEIFVGRLPRNILEPELIPWLEQIGPIFQLRLMMDFSGTNKGFCFVKYFTQEQANLAVEALNSKDLNGHTVVVAKSMDNKRLILSGISTDKTEDDVRHMVEIMSDGVADVEISWDVDDESPTHQRGVAFVTYENHRDAAIARKKMLQNPLFMWNHRVFADWAESGGNRALYRKRDGARQSILVVHGLAPGTRLQTMWQTFKTLGPFCGVEYIQMTRRKDKAFVFFGRRAQAEVAKVAFDGSRIEGYRVRVGWCDPESAPKLPPRKPKALFQKPRPQNVNMEPGPYWSGGEMMSGCQHQQQMWYPQEVVPHHGMMMMPTCGSMSHVSAGISQELAASVEPYYQGYQHQAPGIPAGTVYYYPVTMQTGNGYQYDGRWNYRMEEASSENRTEEGAAYSSPSASMYPSVYWTNYTPSDYYQQVVRQDETVTDNQEEQQPVVQEVEVGRQGEQSDLYSYIWK